MTVQQELNKHGHFLTFKIKVSIRQSKINNEEHNAYLTIMLIGKKRSFLMLPGLHNSVPA
jgi:hypothetical protein